MSKTRFVEAAGLQDFLVFLSRQGRVLAPAERPAASKPSIVFAPWQKGDEICLKKATVPPKNSVLPECEILFTFKKQGCGDFACHRGLSLDNGATAEETVIFGCRPCDARGFDSIDKPFTDGLFVDPYYKARRDKLTVISLTCDSGCETCFCHWVGGGPTSPIGSDILLTEIGNGHVLQAITDKGQALLDKSGLAEAGDNFHKAEEVRKRAWGTLKPAPKLTDAPKKLASMFEDIEFWQHWTERCISCGACTYFCPTCYCFNITDEGEAESPRGGRRLRSWDNCMSSLYTREASGHNPRVRKAQRMRNRVSHKFWTFPANWGSFLCSGCGRCIANCPVYLDIRAIVLAAMDAADNASPKQGE